MIVHMGWVGSSPPAHVARSVDAVRKVAAGCDVRFHTSLPSKWSRAGKLLPMMQSDVLRHHVLLEHGGLWLDADVRLIKNPTEWASAWSRYTAVRLGASKSMIGTDLIYVPPGWGGGAIIEEYIDSFLRGLPGTVSLSALAARMIEFCAATKPELFSVLEPGTRFPFSKKSYTTESVVARGFDPAPQAYGLGDMVAAGLSAIGVTKERVSRAIGRPCKCSQRQRALNEAGAKYLGLPPGETAIDGN